MQLDDNGDRLSERRTVLLQARCRKSSWHVFPVELGDVSQGGCSIIGGFNSFAVGERLRLTIAHLKPIEAQVRWIGEDRVGLEFGAALTSQVIDGLAEHFGIAVTAGRASA